MQNNMKNSLEESLRNWASIAVSNRENRMVIQFTRAFFNISKPIDQYSMWTMVGVAGALVATISNIQDIQSLIGNKSLKIFLIFLGLSIVFGLAQRFFSYRVRISLRSQLDGEKIGKNIEKHGKLESKIQKIACENQVEVDASIDFHRVITKHIEFFPQPYRWLAMRACAKVIKDPNYIYRALIRKILCQELCMNFQLLMVVFSVITMAFSVKIT